VNVNPKAFLCPREGPMIEYDPPELPRERFSHAVNGRDLTFLFQEERNGILYWAEEGWHVAFPRESVEA
jgi:hypothetical protein